jgi:hypothetical protein
MGYIMLEILSAIARVVFAPRLGQATQAMQAGSFFCHQRVLLAEL